jgi:pyruvate/2-oxoglutarate dehydrogenase complex dihydrolipoamide acyltransferase (E2) component
MDVLMPQLGETVAEGKILTWFKAVGDEVNEGDNIFEVETDKVTVEVQAITSGRLSEIRVDAGTVVKVGAVVAVIGEGSAARSPASASAPMPAAIATSTPTPSAAPSPAAPPPVAARQLDPFNEVRTAIGVHGSARGAGDIRISPLARRMIAQDGVDLNALVAQVRQGGGKRVLGRHVRAAPPPAARAPSKPAPTPLAPGASDDVVPLNPIRQKTGERLQESWRTAPHVFQAIDVDFGAVDAVRAARKERFRAQFGFSLTYLPFIARAVCVAIRDFPNVNARFDGDRLLVSRDVNLGIAVDLSFNGLVVPVVRNADDLTLEGLAKAIQRQAEKARTGKMTPDDMTGATYTISNNGAFGTMFTAPIINAPQVAILSTDAVRRRPVILDTPQGETITARPVGIVAQSFDHRAFDGAYSAAFLSRLKELIEGRDWATEFN